ncbi:autotransporter outer membrane beta-barrel domain-containing protein [Mixta intestinalis]|uniref:Extracellular serine protease n=1 Tax=Mixta intestinalis TaxID=1615494 RepID=A0A6P1PZ79_9GAMM|nr:autotransporter outer membrane beta-barrel domain-containing protein [Mixta intestinalis]QHM70985.1 Extracellular serine protease [Mixta intestinalis]
MKKTAIASMLSALYLSQPLYAMENHFVYSPQNNPVFQVRFFDKGDGPFMPDDPQPLVSTWNLNHQQKEKVLQALSYWAQVITPAPGQPPAIINVGTVDDENAFGYSSEITDGVSTLTQLQAALQGMDTAGLTLGSHGQFALGRLDFDSAEYLPSQLPRTGEADLVSVALHELAHGLGIANQAEDRYGAGSYTPMFAREPLGEWAAHLRDDNGNPARPGQTILCTGCNNRWDPQAFDVRQDKGYFTGKHVDEVLAGAMPGVPVKILSEDGWPDDDYMSHIELKNSLMSHQIYRNYTSFMEAELALLQDLGYHIDRRNFFGYSVYGDGQTLVNRHGYFQRNAQGDGYLIGRYNTASLGLGLHVYGSNNRLFQQADLLTSGEGGAGIRVDGQNNTLTIEPGTRVYADGLNGRGIMFSYGKDHSLIQRGDVQATGDYGIALSFDFGNNLLGNAEDFRGSWIHYYDSEEAELLPELTGALVNNVDISGRVAGKAAAIYISGNALVSHINLLNGAALEGNIISDYDWQDVYGRQRLTQLTFGRLADAQGRAREQVDPAFRLRYQGDITGLNNLDLHLDGGITALNGSHHIYSLTIAPNATLAGSSDYTLNPLGHFINNGVLTPGNSLGAITVNGDYQQGDSGQLRLEFDGQGGHDRVTVNGTARLAGSLVFVPQRDWYASGWQLDAQDWFTSSSQNGEFAGVTGLLNSPTLALAIQSGEDGGWRLSMQRAEKAYSQYATGSNAQSVGRVLDRIAAAARHDIQPLYRALDFSSADGSQIGNALHQLSPAAYGSLFASSLYRERQLTQLVNTPYISNSPEVEGWHGFAKPFGGSYQQQRQDGRAGYQLSSYGMAIGAEKRNEIYRDWIWGVHAAVGHQSTTMKAPENGRGKTNAFDLGMQARYAADEQAGLYLFGNGRLGIEKGEMTRRIGVNDYGASHHASWTGWSGALSAGGGYRFALNDRFDVGPAAALSYARIARPSLTESGNDATRLRLDSNHLDSLRSDLGVEGRWQYPLYRGGMLNTRLQLSWQHEMLSSTATQSARFVRYQQERFSSKDRTAGRDALAIRAGVDYQITPTFTLGAGVDSELSGTDYHAVSGNLSVGWRF